MNVFRCLLSAVFCSMIFAAIQPALAQEKPDFIREMQFQAVEYKQADWIHWGDRPDKFSNWTTHSNRLIPVYTFGISLDAYQGENSVYRSEQKLKKLYGKLPTSTLNPEATYFDQTDIYLLQKQAFQDGKKNVILIVFDGMDWQTTQAAAIYKNKKVVYTKGRGTGLSFQDYQGAPTDFGYFVTAPHNNDAKNDVDTQQLKQIGGERLIGGYSAKFGGETPWSQPGDPSYLIGRRPTEPHMYTDSAASATSLTSGIKTYNASINIAPDGSQVEPIARQVQKDGLSIGVVTSVPICHATPACAYANNVSRNDYQDLARDLLGLRSISHRDKALPGVDVLIGGGWGEIKQDDRAKQGQNFLPGHGYLADDDGKKVNIDQGGKYVVAERTADRDGREVLMEGVEKAIKKNARLLGFFGTGGGHLPYQTADGNYDPTRGISKAERYSKGDILENPTLADMTEAALKVLEQNDKGFWLMIEAGDVDWANHNNNVDDSIGAVLSGEAAFDAAVKWVETNSNWDETALILTADHGHMMVLEDLEALAGNRSVPDRKPVKPPKAEKADKKSQAKK